MHWLLSWHIDQCPIFIGPCMIYVYLLNKWFLISDFSCALLKSPLRLSNGVTILHMQRQLSCRSLLKRLAWSDHHSYCKSNMDFFTKFDFWVHRPFVKLAPGDNNHFPQCIVRLILTPLPNWYSHHCINSSASDDMQWSTYILKHNGDFAKQNSTLSITNILSCSAINDFRCISWQKNFAFDWNSIWVYLGYNW